jgi:hypothetical protein
MADTIEIAEDTVWTLPVGPGDVFTVAPGIQFSFDPEPTFGMDSRMADNGGIIVSILDPGNPQ